MANVSSEKGSIASASGRDSNIHLDDRVTYNINVNVTSQSLIILVLTALPILLLFLIILLQLPYVDQPPTKSDNSAISLIQDVRRLMSDV